MLACDPFTDVQLPRLTAHVSFMGVKLKATTLLEHYGLTLLAALSMICHRTGSVPLSQGSSPFEVTFHT